MVSKPAEVRSKSKEKKPTVAVFPGCSMKTSMRECAQDRGQSRDLAFAVERQDVSKNLRGRSSKFTGRDSHHPSSLSIFST